MNICIYVYVCIYEQVELEEAKENVGKRLEFIESEVAKIEAAIGDIYSYVHVYLCISIFMNLSVYRYLHVCVNAFVCIYKHVY
jgi:hypothetical protein